MIGKCTAIGHEGWSGNSSGDEAEIAVAQTRLLYAGANRMTATHLATLDLPEGNAMRAPGEAPGFMALEVAMDEMAEKLGMDPIEFRITNDTQVDPSIPSVRSYSAISLSVSRLEPTNSDGAIGVRQGKFGKADGSLVWAWRQHFVITC